jgi:hypothetical protein
LVAKRAPIWYNFTTSLKKGAKKELGHVYYTQNLESTREKAEERGQAISVTEVFHSTPYWQDPFFGGSLSNRWKEHHYAAWLRCPQ